MVYNARTQRGVLGFLLALTIASISNGLLYFKILLIIFILLAIFIKFELEIDDGYLKYQIFFLSISIYKNVLYPNQILNMKFIRIGWNNKGVIIHVKKWFNIRVVHFSPNNVFIDLIDFAHKKYFNI